MDQEWAVEIRWPEVVNSFGQLWAVPLMPVVEKSPETRRA